MTENKRFTLDEDRIQDNQSPCCYIEYYKGLIPIVDLLNELAEEKKELQFQCNLLREQANEFHRGARENANRVGQLEKENKELKEVIKEVLKLLEEEVDLFSDKATEHDIKAYIELREFDNKDAYYMATATKKAIKLLKEMIE